MPAPVLGESYGIQLIDPDAQGPLEWSVVGGLLPTGLSLSPGGVISGTPTDAGIWQTEVSVTPSGSTSLVPPTVLVFVIRAPQAPATLPLTHGAAPEPGIVLTQPAGPSSPSSNFELGTDGTTTQPDVVPIYDRTGPEPWPLLTSLVSTDPLLLPIEQGRLLLPDFANPGAGNYVLKDLTYQDWFTNPAANLANIPDPAVQFPTVSGTAIFASDDGSTIVVAWDPNADDFVSESIVQFFDAVDGTLLSTHTVAEGGVGAISRDGSRAIVSNSSFDFDNPETTFTALNREGGTAPLPSQPAICQMSGPRLSPTDRALLNCYGDLVGNGGVLGLGQFEKDIKTVDVDTGVARTLYVIEPCPSGEPQCDRWENYGRDDFSPTGDYVLLTELGPLNQFTRGSRTSRTRPARPRSS